MTVEEAINGLKNLCVKCKEWKIDKCKVCAYPTAIKALEQQNEVDAMIDEIKSTNWYHIHNGKLVHGANSKEEGTEPLYIAEDILNICDKYRGEE